MKKIEYFIVFLFFLKIPSSWAQKPGGNIFDVNILHEVRLEFVEDTFWQILRSNYEGTKKEIDSHRFLKTYMSKSASLLKGGGGPVTFEDSIPYLKGNVYIDGTKLNDVGVRLKGFSSYFGSNEYKKSFKIDFDNFNSKTSYLGLKKLNLNNGVGDPSFQRDVLCYNLLRKAGVAVPRTSYARLYINGIYWGLYLIVEQVDKVFLEHNFASSKGNLYKNIGWNNLYYEGDDFSIYKGIIELRTNENSSNGSDYVKLLKKINTSEGFKDSIQQVFNVDYYLKVLAIDIITLNWDSYISHGRNYFLYHEPVSDLFYWIPWDYNLSFEGTFPQSKLVNDADTLCPGVIDFTIDTAGTTVSFKVDTAAYNYENYYWNFGDDDFEGANRQKSIGYGKRNDVFSENEEKNFNPTHKYKKRGIYIVNLYASRDSGACFASSEKKVILIDTVGICKSLHKLKISYIPDENYDKVLKKDNYCCDCYWDNVCEGKYHNLKYPSTVDAEGYAIDYYIEDKPLISNLLNVVDFRERYYDIFKYILDSIYNIEAIKEQIFNNTDLIRDAVYADTNYLYSITQFEADANALCADDQYITSLDRLITKRKTGLENEYNSLSYDPQPIQQVYAHNDIVINEVYTGYRKDEKSGWIELYNNTSNIVPLTGFYISNNVNEPYKWSFPDNVAIKPHSYLVVWDEKKKKKNNLHVNFTLSSAGERLFLNSTHSGMLDNVVVRNQVQAFAYGRVPNGTGNFAVTVPTLNAPNKLSTSIPSTSISNPVIAISPNPTNECLNIVADIPDTYYVVVSNLMGTDVLTTSFTGKTTRLNVNGFKDGIYIVQISCKSSVSNTYLTFIKSSY